MRRITPSGEKGRGTPWAPISWGELIDKITILEIKSVEIEDEAARANVRKELTLLQQLAVGLDAVFDLKRDLKAVSEELWKIEDAIRANERRSQFDEEFIAFATRSISATTNARGSSVGSAPRRLRNHPGEKLQGLRGPATSRRRH